ncbi:MAG TPA: DUF4342 domain-containing protein [Candidatus Limnocylindria bacterium]
MTTQAPPKTEEFKITGDELLAKFRELVHEGNVRRLIIKSDSGTTLLEVPLTIGVIGAALLPVLAAVGALAAVATDCTIVVERRD